VAEVRSSEDSIQRLANRAIISLKVPKGCGDVARDRLCLATPLRATNGETQSIWVGPGHWLLVSEVEPAKALINNCELALSDVLHIAVDQSAALITIRVQGPAARDSLAAGSGVDFRVLRFPVGSCCRTRLAQIAAVVVAVGNDQLEIYVDRSVVEYTINWLTDTGAIAARVSGCAVQ
jgi:sarcosine oxidase, subunit gamma